MSLRILGLGFVGLITLLACGDDGQKNGTAATAATGGDHTTGGDGGTSGGASGTSGRGGASGSSSGGRNGGSGGSGGSGGGGTHDGGVGDADAGGSASGGNGGSSGGGGMMVDAGPPPMGMLPLNDLGKGTYMGFQGGLYPNGSNDVPADHRAAGIARANQIQPLDADGNPSASGKIVLMSIGMSNCTMEFCFDWNNTQMCSNGTFVAQALADAAVDDTNLVMVDGAISSQVAQTWSSPTMPNYDTVRDMRLSAAGVTEAQVQAIWVKNANSTPQVSLPADNADAYRLEQNFGDVMRALAVRYPNLKEVFVSSRTYGGYATTQLNPEPYAYEGGFAVKWLIEAQITQASGGAVDPQSGDLDYEDGTAPWLAWGPYLWAAGTDVRSDGLSWERSDFGPDGTHPERSGQEKVGALLLQHFKTSPFTRCWFLAAHPACE